MVHDIEKEDRGIEGRGGVGGKDESRKQCIVSVSKLFLLPAHNWI